MAWPSISSRAESKAQSLVGDCTGSTLASTVRAWNCRPGIRRERGVPLVTEG